MMRIAVYTKSTGRIQRVMSCPDDQVALQLGKGEAFIEVEAGVRDDTHMIVNGKPMSADPRSLPQIKLDQWTAIKLAREQFEQGGFTWDGSRFDSTPAAQASLQAAALRATLPESKPFTVNWTLADNTVRTLSATDVIAVAQSLGAHIEKVHEIGRELRVSIDAANTAAEVLTVNWPV